MKWNKHLDIIGSHAFLGPSRHYWINYSDERLAESYSSYIAAQKGTELHEFAEQCIKLGQKLPNKKSTLNMYVNDAIGYKMVPEQIMYYSPNCYGTADSICFRNNKLRIHDLKTGSIPAHMEQLIIYAALFCLEYRVKPRDIEIELRIYQSDEILYHRPEADEVQSVMDKIVRADKIISKMREQED